MTHRARLALYLAVGAAAIAPAVALAADRGDGHEVQLVGTVQQADGGHSALAQIPTTPFTAPSAGDRALLVDGRFLPVLRGLDGPAPGTRVTVTATRTGDGLVVHRTRTLPGVQARATSTPVHRVTMVLYAPKGYAPDGTTVAAASDSLRATADYWREQSGGEIDLQIAKAVGWVQGTTATCASVFGMFNEAATLAGWKPTGGAGDHLAIYVPARAGGACPAGVAVVGGGVMSGGTALASTLAPSVMAHELGHNFGLDHSNALSCPTSDTVLPVPSTCTWREYGDPLDVMGNSGAEAAINAHVYDQLGFSPALTRVSTVGTTQVRIAPRSATGTVSTATATVTTAPGAVVTDPDGVSYWLEYRAAVGRDTRLGGSFGTSAYGVRILRRDHRLGRGSMVLDATPPRLGTDGDRSLVVDRPWLSANRKLRLVVTGQDAAGATLSVTTSATDLKADAPPTSTVPEDDPTTGQVVAATTIPSAAYKASYSVLGMVLSPTNLAMKSVPVQLQAYNSAGTWTAVKTSKTGPTGQVSFTVKAAATEVPVRLVTLDAAGAQVLESATLTMPVYTPVTITKLPKYVGGVWPELLARSALPEGASFAVDYRALDSRGKPAGADTRVLGTARVVDAAKGDIAFPLELPGKGAYELRLVRLATQTQLESQTKWTKTKVL